MNNGDSNIYCTVHTGETMNPMTQLLMTFAIITTGLATISASEEDDHEFCTSDSCSETADDDNTEVAGVIDRSLNGLDQADSRLVEAVRKRFLVAPAADRKLNLSLGVMDNPNLLRGQFGQPIEVDKLYR